MDHALFLSTVHRLREAQKALRQKYLPDPASTMREMIALEREVDEYLLLHLKPRPADAFGGEDWGAEGERSEG